MAKQDLEPILPGSDNPFTCTEFINYVLGLLKAVTQNARVYPKGTAKIIGNNYAIDLTEAINDLDDGQDEDTPANTIPDGYEEIAIEFCTGDPPITQTRRILARKVA